MLSIDDPRWKTYRGGYHLLYDASVPLKRLFEFGPSDELWDELWQELYHQHDVDSASYAAVPCLVEYARRSPQLDWQIFGLISAIELARPFNPALPPELAQAYFAAIESIPAIVSSHPHRTWDAVLTQCVVACIALARGQRLLARRYLQITLDDARQWYRDKFGSEPDD